MNPTPTVPGPNLIFNVQFPMSRNLLYLCIRSQEPKEEEERKKVIFCSTEIPFLSSSYYYPFSFPYLFPTLPRYIYFLLRKVKEEGDGGKKRRQRKT